MDEDTITLIDEESGEEVKLRLIDRFDKDERFFSVLLTLAENDDDAQLVILEELEEGEDILLQSLDESEEDEIYDYYDALCEAELDEEDDSEA